MVKKLYAANLNFQSLQVVSDYRDPQLQVIEKLVLNYLFKNLYVHLK